MKPNKFVAYTFACLVIVGFVYAVDEPTNSAKQLTVCEGETAKLSCPNGTVISIQLANYGRFSVVPCNPDADASLSTSCINEKTLPILRERCDVKANCIFNVSNSVFGDSCPETSKYLEVRYLCVPAPATTTTTTTTPIPTTTTTKKEEKEVVKSGVNKNLEDIFVKTTTPPRTCKKTFQRHLEWPETELGKMARIKCPAGTKGNAEWNCSEFGEWTPKTGADLSRCVSDWSEKLLKDVTEEHDELATQLETLKEVHSYSRRQTLVGGDLIMIKSIVEQVVENYINIMKSTGSSSDGRKTGYKMSKFWIESINHLLGNEQRGAWFDLYPNKQREIANSFITSSEQLLSAIFPIMPTSSQEFDSEDIVAKPNVMAQASTVRVEDYVLFPSVPMGNDIAQIPREALETSREGSAQVIYVNYDGLAEYLKPLEYSKHEERHKKLVSRIISVNLVNGGKPEPIVRVTRPIILEFKTEVNEEYSNPQCVWWDKTQLEWSSNGCEVKGFNKTHTTCGCNHTANFGVLMDLVEERKTFFYDELLMTVTYIGCIISLLFLFFSFLSFLIFGEPKYERNCIQKNLTLILIMVEILFLYGIQKTEHTTTCFTVAGLLHFFIISAFAWMFLEGYNLYSLLVQIGPEKSKKPYLYLLGYGIPSIIVGICLYFYPEYYGSESYCWLIPSRFLIYSFVIPTLIMLCLNSIFLIMTLCEVCKHSNVGYKPCTYDMDTVKTIRSWLKLSLCFIFIFGSTLIFGFLWLEERVYWMSYAFAGLNVFLGLYIFVFYVLLNEKMHKDFDSWKRRNNWFPDCLNDSSNERRTGPYLSSTVTSTQHCGTSNSSHGSEGMFPGSQQWTLDRFGQLKNAGHMENRLYNGSMREAMASNYQPRIREEAYDYATIPYDIGDGRGVYPTSRMQFDSFRAFTSDYRSMNNCQSPMSRPPPKFKPPPPPQISSLPLSDDSAYSDSGGSSSRSPNSGVSRSGTMLLRMDLTKNPPVFCEDV